MDSNTILWITAVIMLAGGLLILAVGKRRTPSEGMQTVLHGIVPIIAACLYFAMATGQGAVALPTNLTIPGGTPGVRIFYYGRYVDWAFTTPLLLLSLSLTAMHAGRKRTGAIVGCVLADVMMIGTAFAFGASEVGWVKWIWFLISCVAFLGVYYVIWVSQMEANKLERDDIQSSYKQDAAILSVLWFGYPIILAITSDGAGLISDASGVLLIAILDVLSKPIYGLLTVSQDAKATDRDLAEQNTAVPTLRTA